ncbi:DUF1330 domain-containing protein [Maritalea sp.]|uniref:DUF1330 domain-containing protein n=1 Tax=Maritalea sp. TaxID=2003361 RepID=UPI0039E3F8BA
MSAFVIATAKIKDKVKFGEYGKAAAQTLATHGGTLVRRGQYSATLAGEGEHQGVAVLEFPDMDALNAWFNSPDYQAVVPLRNEACDMTITSYATPAA